MAEKQYIIVSINDAPSLISVPAAQAVLDNATLHPFALAAVVDPDFNAEVSFVVQLDTTTYGALSSTFAGGSYNAVTGKYTYTGSVANATAALQSLVFTPSATALAYGATATTRISVAVTDTLGLSAATQTTTITTTSHASPPNTAPVLGPVTAALSVIDNATLRPFQTVAITDADLGETETLVVTLSNPSNGTLSATLGGVAVGSYDPVTGEYTYTGSVANATAALAALVFTPSATALAYGATATTVLSVDVTDAAHASAVTQTTTITTTSHASPPANSDPGDSDPSSDAPVNPVTPASALDYSADPLGRMINLSLGAALNASGGSGDDSLVGNGLNNLLNGGGGNNHLWGSGGNDTLVGGAGSNGFWAGRGDGQDRITQSPTNAHDALYLYNIQPGDPSFGVQRSGNDLQLALGEGSTLNITDWYTLPAANRIQGFFFADQTVYGWNDGQGAYVNLSDPCYASLNVRRVTAVDTGPSVLRGSSGDDVITGGSGNNHLWGAGGNDTLVGGAGSNGFWVGRGDGQDRITQSPTNAHDALYLYNIQPGDPSFGAQRSGNDLQLALGEGSTLNLTDWYTLPAANRIQGFFFADQTVYGWNNGQGAYVNLSDPCYASRNVRRVTAVDTGPSVLYGSSGDDVITGGSGNDRLRGSGGNDSLAGGMGLDNYQFGTGDGQDVIVADNLNSLDIVDLYNMTDPAGISTHISGNDLILRFSGGAETLTLQNWALGGGFPQLNSFLIGGAAYHLTSDGGSWQAG